MPTGPYGLSEKKIKHVWQLENSHICPTGRNPYYYNLKFLKMSRSEMLPIEMTRTAVSNKNIRNSLSVFC